MTYLITAEENGKLTSITADDSKTILEHLRLDGSSIHAPCGGNGTCNQCRVRVSGAVKGFDGEVRLCEDEEILACRYYLAGDIRVSVCVGKGAKVLTESFDIAPGGEGLGFAVDIGTTTVAAYLYDLSSGKCIGKSGEMNAQRAFGSDVISRIQCASNQEGLDALCRVIRKQLATVAAQMCDDVSKIKYVSIAANTVMEHLFVGLSPESIGVAPFTPLSLFGEECAANEHLEGFAPDCRLYLCPAVAGYVGGDITAGLLSSGASGSEETVLFIDIGTNGEMALGDKNGFICCATAAGPAFEGAEIDCGSPAQDGAINTVAPDLSFTVLGDTAPKSICGSGLIDAVAALLHNEEIDEGGYLEDDYYFSDEVYLSGKDVRCLQLAKAAVRAGVETLLQRSGKSYDDISEVLIAGGFGAYMSIKSACAIGLLPPALMERTRHVGNSAGRGAALCLSEEGRNALAQLSKICSYEELSSSALFNDNYIEAMMFDEYEEVLS